MSGMESLLAVAGVGIVSELVGNVLENIGQGNKVIFVRIIGYIACAYIAWDVWWDGVHYVARTFGVHI